MDKNHRERVENKLIATEDKLWLPPLSPKDQEKLNRLRKKQTKASNERIGFSGKSVWDWLNLLGVLAIPFVVTVVGLYFTQQITQQQDTANKQQHKIDLQIAEDQQRETTLQTYLNNMSDLLLNHNLRKSKSGDEASQVARERTLTVLRRLDAGRNGIVLQFLHDAHLIGKQNAVIDLSGTDLSNDDLRGVNLSGVNLSRADLSFSFTNLGYPHLTSASSIKKILTNGYHPIGVNLSDANLSGATFKLTQLSFANLSGADLSRANLDYTLLNDANLSGANLSGAHLDYTLLDDANLSNTYLSGDSPKALVDYLFGVPLIAAHLSNVYLSGANLSNDDLRGVNLSGVDLSGANLRGATVTQEQLNGVKSLQGAVMPDGSIHP